MSARLVAADEEYSADSRGSPVRSVTWLLERSWEESARPIVRPWCRRRLAMGGFLLVSLIVAGASCGTLQWSRALTSHVQAPVPAAAEKEEGKFGLPLIAVAKSVREKAISVASRAGLQVASTVTMTTTCFIRCSMDDNVNFPGNDLRHVTNVSSAQECCQECGDDAECVAWTWGKQTLRCFLKGSRPRAQLTKVMDQAFTSGQPLMLNRSSIQLLERPEGQSLFCFSLMVPWGYESHLLLEQFDRGVSIFACDEYAVFSNQLTEVAPGVESVVFMDGDLTVEKGGEFGTALNTPIFISLWQKIFEVNRFRFHHWTVKVDPDAVFFASRLRYSLLGHMEAPTGVYINNCKMGMHGPIEVFSRNAVYHWQQGLPMCTQHFNQLCSGPCKWGEDMFIDQCLWKVLQVRRDTDTSMLLEDHCDPPANWWRCEMPGIVAFHPFKTWEGYSRCLDNAEALAH